MASESDISELSSHFRRLIHITNMSLRRFNENLNQDSENPHHERILLLNPRTQGMMVIDGASSLESLFRDLAAGITKSGKPPATKESIEGLPSVEIGETEKGEGECVVCLEEFEIGGVVKEMPCKHRFHCNCIEKWLGIHGSCPVCRFEMPLDEGKKSDESDDEDEDEGERRSSGEVWVGFSFNGRTRNRRTREDQNSAADSVDSTSSPISDDADVEGS